MHCAGQWLSKEVCEVVFSFAPRDGKVALPYAIANPMEAHVDGLRALDFARVIGDSRGGCVIAHDEGGRLRVAESFPNGTFPFALLSVKE